MKRYILHKTCILVILIFTTSIVTFSLIHLLPGDPVREILGEGADKDDIARIRQRLNLDKPLINQYGEFLKNLVSLRLGHSLYRGQDVGTIIFQYFPKTLILSVSSLLLAIFISFPLGTWAAFKRHQSIDLWVTFSSSVTQAIPSFFLGPILILFFSIYLGLLPVSGSEGLSHLVLPTLTLGLSLSGYLTRIIRASLVTELSKPYLILAYSKGLSTRQIFTRHLLKNASIPIVTTIGMQLGLLLSGAIIVENIFSWEGIGSLLVQAVRQRDYPVVQGVVIFITSIYLVLNFIIDIPYFFLDPRIRNEIR